MLKYLKKYWFFCLLAPLFMVGEVAMDLIQPDMMADIVDNGVLKNDIKLIITVGVKMIFMVMLGGFSGVLCGVFANIAAQNFGNDLRKDLFAKIMSLSFQQTDSFTTGSLITRLTNDITMIQNLVNQILRMMVRTFMMFGGGVIMLLTLNVNFGLVLLCVLPLQVWVMWTAKFISLLPRLPLLPVSQATSHILRRSCKYECTRFCT